MRPLHEILKYAVDNPEVLRKARAQGVLRRWEEAVGTVLATHCVPDNYDQGMLWIASTNSAWASELRMRKGTVLSRLNEMAEEPGLFQDLRVGTRRPRPHAFEP